MEVVSARYAQVPEPQEGKARKGHRCGLTCGGVRLLILGLGLLVMLTHLWDWANPGHQY